jgi:hypothetical protein
MKTASVHIDPDLDKADPSLCAICCPEKGLGDHLCNTEYCHGVCRIISRQRVRFLPQKVVSIELLWILSDTTYDNGVSISERRRSH